MPHRNSPYLIFTVIPMKIGIQIYPHYLDYGFRRNGTERILLITKKLKKIAERSRQKGVFYAPMD
ncbi:MAG: hypothetical protein DI586_08470 [Micavibrio aeruginosavorus]|uniref:Uncharacterized protein n=1 Tax=Micavibrio aeruginosavorus TaxID=349221 RepID=A0A2W5FM64_9BACT|nr:MAG: hypothetical protein DI586_08470 [Micavibrio aeruginosavorus]